MFDEFEEMTREIQQFQENVAGVEGLLELINKIYQEVSTLGNQSKSEIEKVNNYILEMEKYQDDIINKSNLIVNDNKDISNKLSETISQINTDLITTNKSISDQMISITTDVVSDLLSGGKAVKDNLITAANDLSLQVLENSKKLNKDIIENSKKLNKDIIENSEVLNDKMLATTNQFKEEITAGSQHYTSELKNESQLIKEQIIANSKDLIKTYKKLEEKASLNQEESYDHYNFINKSIKKETQSLGLKQNRIIKEIDGNQKLLLEEINIINKKIETLEEETNELIAGLNEKKPSDYIIIINLIMTLIVIFLI